MTALELFTKLKTEKKYNFSSEKDSTDDGFVYGYSLWNKNVFMRFGDEHEYNYPYTNGLVAIEPKDAFNKISQCRVYIALPKDDAQYKYLLEVIDHIEDYPAVDYADLNKQTIYYPRRLRKSK